MSESQKLNFLSDLLSWRFEPNEADWLFIDVNQSRQIPLTEFWARLAKLGFDLQTLVVKALFMDFDLHPSGMVTRNEYAFLMTRKIEVDVELMKKFRDFIMPVVKRDFIPALYAFDAQCTYYPRGNRRLARTNSGDSGALKPGGEALQAPPFPLGRGGNSAVGRFFRFASVWRQPGKGRCCSDAAQQVEEPLHREYGGKSGWDPPSGVRRGKRSAHRAVRRVMANCSEDGFPAPSGLPDMGTRSSRAGLMTIPDHLKGCPSPRVCAGAYHADVLVVRRDTGVPLVVC